MESPSLASLANLEDADLLSLCKDKSRAAGEDLGSKRDSSLLLLSRSPLTEENLGWEPDLEK
jgi:hypothetical protein